MQNYIIYIFIIIFLLVAIYFAFIWWKKRKKLSPEKIKDFQKKLKQIGANISSKEKIIDSDKLYHKILLEAWYNWDFWTILKQKPIIINDLDLIWKLHKVRNKLVHDFDYHDENFLQEISKTYQKEIEKLLKKVQ